RFSRDWSSDVCSSDLRLTGSNQLSSKGAAEDQPSDHPEGSKGTNQNKGPPPPVIDRDKGNDEGSDHRSCCGAAVEDTIGQRSIRSEERRVGKECRAQC